MSLNAALNEGFYGEAGAGWDGVVHAPLVTLTLEALQPPAPVVIPAPLATVTVTALAATVSVGATVTAPSTTFTATAFAGEVVAWIDDPAEAERPRTGVELQIFHRNDWSQRIRTVRRASGVEWYDPLAVGGEGVGWGTFKLSAGDKLIRGATQDVFGIGEFSEGNVVRCLINGRTRFAWIIDDIQLDRVGDGEDADSWFTFRGPGLIAATEDVIVMSEAQAETGERVQRLAPDERPFTFASKLYRLAWGDWTAAIHDYAIVPDIPDGWPVNESTATWIHGPAGGDLQYFRETLTLDSITLLSIVAAAGGDLEVFIDGAPVVTTTGVRNTGVADIQLPAGEHQVAVLYRQRGATNGFILAIGEESGETDDGDPTYDWVEVSGTHWMAHADTDPPPSWSPGQVARTVLNEGLLRATIDEQTMSIENIVTTWSRTRDTDGVAWPELVDRYWQLGTSLLTVLLELTESAIEVYMSPWGRLKLYADERGTDRTTGPGAVKLQPGYGVTKMTHKRRRGRANHLLGRYAGGYFEAHRDAPQRREGYLEVGTADSRTEGRRLTRRALDMHAGRTEVIEVTMTAWEGVTPYDAFHTGDYLLAPTMRGAARRDELEYVAHRVLALTVRQADPDGEVSYTPELVRVD